mgnify:CR=1 FL=1
MKKRKLILAIFMIFLFIFGSGISFMQYDMLNPTMNLFMILIGGIGTVILGAKIVKE